MKELSPEQVRKVCEPSGLELQTTKEIGSLKGIIGQERAVGALQFGLDIPDRGFNIYVAGLPGTGKTTAVQSFLKERARSQPVPPDWCYVNNFQDPYRPQALRLPAGRGRKFQQDVKALVEQAQRDIQQAFESEEYSKRREEIQAEFNRHRQALFDRMGKRAQETGFLFQVTPTGIALIPIKDGKPLEQPAFLALEPQVKRQLEERQASLQQALNDMLKEVRGLQKTAQQKIEQMDREVALYAVGDLIEGLVGKYGNLPEVVTFLRDMEEDVLEHIEPFRGRHHGSVTRNPLHASPGCRKCPFGHMK